MKGAPTILIVDDERTNCRLLEALLEPEGYTTVSAASGIEALAAVLEHSIDLILLDVMMPGMSGYEVATALKADPRSKNIPIVMVSARADRDSRLDALTSGVEEFLAKPVDRSELWLRVRNLLRLKEFTDDLIDSSAVLEQRVAERAADLHRFRMAMDSTLDAIMLANRSTMTFVEANETASRMTGYAREELLSLPLTHLYAVPEGEVEASFDAMISGGNSQALTTLQLQRKDGSYVSVEMYAHAQLSGDDWIIVAVLRDITDREEADRQLHHLAHYDALTGLPNRASFDEALTNVTALAATRGWTVATLFLDLDDFKNVNDTLGHAAGDALLIQVAERLVRCMSIRDTVGRLGGDEFGLILLMDEGDEVAADVASEIRESLRDPFLVGGQELHVTASIGISLYPQDSADPATLLKYADTAMYRAKDAERDTFRFFTAQMNVDLVARLNFERALRDAIAGDQFILHYQPKVQVSGGRVAGVEALLRWDRPGHGLVPPGDFIPVLESTGLITEVGGWVISEACRQIAEWVDSGVGPVRVAVNISGRQFLKGDLDTRIAAALEIHGVAADLLEVELTESTLMASTDETIVELQALKALGVRLSIDDFGTGYSCLAYLRHFPIDELKIDIAFVRHVVENTEDAAIVQTIIQLGHSLKLDVVAEGVETEAQLAHLALAGCDQIQGYLISKPLPAAEFAAFLLKEARLLPQRGSASPTFHATMSVVGEDVAHDRCHALSARPYSATALV